MDGAYRVKDRGQWWSPNGLSTFYFLPGEVLAARDPRVAGGFFEVGMRKGWIEPVEAGPAETKPEPSPDLCNPKEAEVNPFARQAEGPTDNRALPSAPMNRALEGPPKNRQPAKRPGTKKPTPRTKPKKGDEDE